MKKIKTQKILIIMAISVFLFSAACGKQTEPVEAFSPVQQLDEAVSLATPEPTPEPGQSTPEVSLQTPKPTVTVEYAEAGKNAAEETPVSTPANDIETQEGGPVITKQPTDETISEGEDAIFIAYADAYDYMSWRVYNPERTESYSPVVLPSMFGQGMYYYGDTSCELALCCVPSEMSGWYVQAFFTKDGKTTATDRVVLNVVEPHYRELTIVPDSGVFDKPVEIKFRASKDAIIQYEFYFADTGEAIDSGMIRSGEKLTIGASKEGQYAFLFDNRIAGRQIRLEAYQWGMPEQKVIKYYTVLTLGDNGGSA